MNKDLRDEFKPLNSLMREVKTKNYNRKNV
jgi:hypothetical protein